jgi:nucleoid-associated protein YgaU
VSTSIALVHAGAGGSLTPPSPSGDDSRPQVERAKLKLFDSKPTKAGRKPEGGEFDSIDFQFNPKEVTIAKSAKWERKPERGAKTAGPPQFSGAEPCKLTLEMFFDATGAHDGSVVAAVEKLFSCCVPTEKTANEDKPVPPLVVFNWGNITSFPAFVTQVSAKYTLFSSGGTPIRAVCSVTLEEMPGEEGQQNPTSGSLAVRRVHRMVIGDSLASVAFAEYGDATLWRRLAEFNRIDDPQRIPLGSVVMVPTAAELLAPVGAN